MFVLYIVNNYQTKVTTIDEYINFFLPLLLLVYPKCRISLFANPFLFSNIFLRLPGLNDPKPRMLTSHPYNNGVFNSLGANKLFISPSTCSSVKLKKLAVS